MLQFGIAGLILAIPALLDGRYVGGLLCIFAGLFFISTRKVPMDTKLTWSSISKPVYDGDDLTYLDQVARVLAYLALAAAVAVWAAQSLS